MKTKIAVRVLFLAAISSAGLVVVKAQPIMGLMTNGLVAYYPMHGDATEATGHGMNGMLMGSPHMATNRFGQPMQALAFNGDMDGMMLTNLNVNLATNAENTVCFWMNWNGQTGGAANPVSMPFGWGNTNQAYCLLFQGTNSGRFGFSGGMGDVYGMGSAMMGTNTWMHIAAVFNNGTTTGSPDLRQRSAHDRNDVDVGNAYGDGADGISRPHGICWWNQRTDR